MKGEIERVEADIRNAKPGDKFWMHNQHYDARIVTVLRVTSTLVQTITHGSFWRAAPKGRKIYIGSQLGGFGCSLLRLATPEERAEYDKALALRAFARDAAERKREDKKRRIGELRIMFDSDHVTVSQCEFGAADELQVIICA